MFLIHKRIKPFSTQRGTLTNLRSLSGPTGVSFANGVNDSGGIAGQNTIAPGSYVPFVNRKEIMEELATNFNGGAVAINNAGLIVGNGMTQNGAFFCQNGSFIELGTLGWF